MKIQQLLPLVLATQWSTSIAAKGDGARPRGVGGASRVRPDRPMARLLVSKSSKSSSKDETPAPSPSPVASDTPTVGDDDDDDSSPPKSADRDSDSCIDDAEPRPYRKGPGRFRFKITADDAVCVDGDDHKFQYGQINEVEEFSECAEKCVMDGNEELLAELVGYDWHCMHSICRCLYNKGALGDQDTDDEVERFVKVNEEHSGDGKVEDGMEKDGWYCAHLSQNEEVWGGVTATTSRRALRA